MKSIGASKPPGCPNGGTRRFLIKKLSLNVNQQHQQLQHSNHIHDHHRCHRHRINHLNHNNNNNIAVTTTQQQHHKRQHYRLNHYHNYFNLMFNTIVLFSFFILNTPVSVLCDDVNTFENINGYSLGPEITTTEFSKY